VRVFVVAALRLHSLPEIRPRQAVYDIWASRHVACGSGGQFYTGDLMHFILLDKTASL